MAASTLTGQHGSFLRVEVRQQQVRLPNAQKLQVVQVFAHLCRRLAPVLPLWPAKIAAQHVWKITSCLTHFAVRNFCCGDRFVMLRGVNTMRLERFGHRHAQIYTGIPYKSKLHRKCVLLYLPHQVG